MMTISRNDIMSIKDIEITDSNKKLSIFCYNSCTENSPEIIKKCRGIIFDDTGNLVMQTFPFTPEFSTSSFSLDTFDINNYSYYNSQEGTIIRMFFYDTKWYISTHKKLNAFSSFWSAKTSFGDYFAKAIDTEISKKSRLYEKINEVQPQQQLQEQQQLQINTLEGFKSILDTKNQYVFLISNSDENRIVCTANKDVSVFHICTFDEDKNCTFDDDIGIPHPEKLEFSDMSDIIRHVDQTDFKKFQGVIAFNKKTPFEHFKIINDTYKTLFDVRGNESSVKFRYLQLRNTDKVELLKTLYPTCDYKEIEDCIDGISAILYKAYVYRFIKKYYVLLPQEEFRIIKDCHSFYLADRQVLMTLDTVRRIMNNYSAVHLNRMIKHFKFELRKTMVIVSPLPVFIEQYTYTIFFNMLFRN